MGNYILAFPIAAILYHSMYILLNKYKDKERLPWWFVVYVLGAVAYIVLVPASFIVNITSKLHLSNAVSACAGAGTGLIVLFILIKYSPTSNKKKNVDDSI